MSNVTRRRTNATSPHPDGGSMPFESPSNGEAARDPLEYDDDKAPKFTLMEEILLLGLKDKQGYLSFWNDNISYALRGCIVMELAFRGRIAIDRESRRERELHERQIEVINDKQTGEVLLDEALKMMKTSERLSVSTWIDLMSGETWNVMKIGYQLKQVRERLAKGLVDKGVLRTEKRNFLLFDMATHPIADMKVKEEVIRRVCATLRDRSGVSSSNDFRTICMICAAYAANVLENALANLDSNLREKAFEHVDNMMNEFSKWPFMSTGNKMEIPQGQERCWEVIAGVLNVFTKMDTIL